MIMVSFLVKLLKTKRHKNVLVYDLWSSLITCLRFSCIRADAFQHGWMDELGFYVPSTVFQSFRDDGMVNMKVSVQ